MDAGRAVSLRPEPIASFEAWPSGVAVSRANRVFVSFPRVARDPSAPTLVEVVEGRAVPFPDPSPFVSIHGIAMAPGNRLFALDTGSHRFAGCEPGLARLNVIDLDRDAVVRAIGFPLEVCLPTSYLNDLVVDADRGKAGYAFISDSGAGAVIVVDLDSGRSWRRLNGHPTVRVPVPDGFGIATERGIVAAPPLIDGIALSPDARTLWWAPLGSYAFFSAPTEVLREPKGDDDWIGRHVTTYRARDFASDGMDTDREGRVYFTDLAHGTVQRYLPAEDRFEMLLGGPGPLRWPDAVRLGPDRTLYVTDSQLDRAPIFTGGADEREPPYRLYRAAIDADPARY